MTSSRNGDRTSASIPLLLGASAGAYLSYRIAKYLARPKPKHPYPPGPPPTHWLLGNALELPDVRRGKHMDLKFLEWAKEFGRYFTIKLPGIGHMIVVSDPDLAKHILVTENIFKSWTYKTFLPLVGSKSLLILPDKEWKNVRKSFNPGFMPSFLKTVVRVIHEKLDRLIVNIDKDITNEVPTTFLTRAQIFTGDVIVQVAFGEDWGGSQVHPAREWHTELQDLCATRGVDVGVMLFGFRTKWRIRKLGNMLDEKMYEILEKRLEQNSTNADAKGSAAKIEDGVVKKYKDICSIAIDLMKDDHGKLTKDDKEFIMHQLKTFYFAGNDTTATLISWTIWLLSQHSDVLEKTRKELADQGIYENGAVPTYDQLQKCSFLEAVLKETLRLYPPAGSARYSANAGETWVDPKTGTEYAIGHAILYLSHYVMHRHPSLWKDPDTFRPERFLDGSEDDVASKFHPFSKGPRDCIGKYFAMLEAKQAVAKLCLSFDFDCVDLDEEISYKVTSTPMKGARIVFRRRS